MGDTGHYVPTLTYFPINIDRYHNLIQRFKVAYGAKPDFLVRAPGRVNIIGEHIDYSGYGVLPMAIERDSVMAVRIVQEDTVTIHNFEAENFQPLTFDKRNLQVDASNHAWTNYFLCGYRGIIENIPKLRDSIEKNGGKDLAGFQVMVHGTVPKGSGLSSSSALVCASALATLRANNCTHELTKSDLARITAHSEQYMGLQSGGMDQAISFLGQTHNASKIDFNPVRSSPVSLPESAVFFVAHSMVESNKYHTADTCYNKRVVECRLAAALLAKGLGHPYEHIKLLQDIQQLHQCSVTDMIPHVRSILHEEPYSLIELTEILGIGHDHLISKYIGTQIQSNCFFLYQRALHVFSETNLVDQFVQIAGDKSLDEMTKLPLLGSLMNQSHESCNINFDCSCPELNALTDICRRAGALGSRLTGAGWGGCTVSMVPSSVATQFQSEVRQKYFGSVPESELAEVFFQTSPAQGACVIPLSYENK